MVVATRSRRFNFLVMLMMVSKVLGKDLFRLELTMVEKGSFNIPGKVHDRYLSSCCRYGYIVCHAGEAGEGRHIHHRSARVGCPESYSAK